MRRPRRQQGYLLAALAAAVVLLLRLLFSESFDEQALFLPFLLAVAAAAWWGGAGPGLLATGLGLTLGLVFLVPPLLSLSISRAAIALDALMFLLIGSTISILCEALHAAQRSEAEKQFRTLADSIPQQVWMARPDGHRFWFNERWYEYTGARPQQTIGWRWQAFHDPAELPATLEKWRASLETGQPWEDTFRLRRYDGQMRWQLARARPVKDERGEIVCWFGTNTDITQRLETEQALKDADRRKDEFLATLAHELRNPLSPIRNALVLWPRVQDDSQEMDHLREIMCRQVQQMTRLVDDLMDVSRISHGQIPLRKQELDVGTLVARAVEENQPFITSCGHTLSMSAPAAPIRIEGDSARLTQVFANLLNNAAKYTPPHGTIEISAGVEGRQAVIRVRDNGSGIPREMLSTIFDMFQQVDMSLERSQGGLGIGLTLVKRLVELHGGTVEAQSGGPGEGSEFIVRLPLALAGQRESSLSTRKPRAAAAPRQILIVDDYDTSGETLAMVLQYLGHRATAVTSGAAALAYLVEHKPDVVFIDIAMPRMNGYEVARRIREDPALADVYLVALTGHGRDSDRTAAFEAGFNSHLTKPANVETVELLLASLGRQPTAAPAPCGVSDRSSDD